MPVVVTINSTDRAVGETNDCLFNVQWPEVFNSTDGVRWRACVRSFAVAGSSSADLSWIELRLSLGSVASWNTNSRHGIISCIVPIAAVSGQFSEVWVDVQSLKSDINAGLYDQDGQLLYIQGSDKSIAPPGEWIVQIEFAPICPPV